MSKNLLIAIILLSIISGIIIAGCGSGGIGQITVPPTVTSTTVPELVNIKGQALEVNGIPIPNAFVVCVNTGLSASLSALADTLGNYLFKNLPPGNYRIEIWRSEGDHNSSPGSPIGAVNITVTEGTITVNVTAGTIDPTATPTVTPAVTNTPTVTNTPAGGVTATSKPGGPTNTPGGPTNTPTDTPTPSWKNVGNAGFSAGEAKYPSLSVYNEIPYISYTDYANDGKCTVMMYNGSTWNPVGNPGFSSFPIGPTTSLYVSNGIPYVAYVENGITVKMYNGTNWVTVGNENFSPAGADHPSLYVYNETPYVAFQDMSVDGKCTVMMFDGTNWVNLGKSGVSGGDIAVASLYVYNGIPYVAYADDYAHGHKATVMMYNGTSWAAVGSIGSSATYVSLYIYEGTLYVAYDDYANGQKATVKMYNGTNWVTVGNAGFSSGQAGIWPSVGLYIYDGTPYLAYTDYANGQKATVMKFDGTNWMTVGDTGFSAGQVWALDLSVSNGIPYVGYKDNANGNKATVMKFSN